MSDSNLKRVHPPKFKVQVVLELFKEQQTVGEICSRFQIHPSQAHSWKRLVLEQLPDLFTNKLDKLKQDREGLIQELYQQIGQLKVE